MVLYLSTSRELKFYFLPSFNISGWSIYLRHRTIKFFYIMLYSNKMFRILLCYTLTDACFCINVLLMCCGKEKKPLFWLGKSHFCIIISYKFSVKCPYCCNLLALILLSSVLKWRSCSLI